LSYGRPREERLMCEYNTIASTNSKLSKYRTSNSERLREQAPNAQS
jgi:hypothetical protein